MPPFDHKEGSGEDKQCHEHFLILNFDANKLVHQNERTLIIFKPLKGSPIG